MLVFGVQGNSKGMSAILDGVNRFRFNFGIDFKLAFYDEEQATINSDDSATVFFNGVI